jgi:hypothetical protein
LVGRRREAPKHANGESLGFHVKDLGVHNGFAIIRDSDGHEMRKGLRSYSEAMRVIRLEFVNLRITPGGMAEVHEDYNPQSLSRERAEPRKQKQCRSFRNPSLPRA